MPQEEATAPLLLVEQARLDAGTLLRVAGELDIATAPRLRAAIERAATAAGLVVLDLGDLDFIDVSGLRVIIDGQQQLGPRLRLQEPSPPVRRLLDLAGLAGGPLRHPDAAALTTRLELVRRLWDAFIAGTAQTVEELVPDGVEWIPFADPGRVLRSAAELYRYWETAHTRPAAVTELTDLGGDVLVRCELPGSPGPAKEIWALMQFEGERLRRGVAFEDRAEALAYAA
jgi:anti-sigma B factor antagonist